MHGLNGVLFASAAIPTWLLARELALSRLAALCSAFFAVALPWSVIGGFVMTESAAYPAALWALLAIHRAVVLPSPRRDLVALAAILVATLARPQLAALGVVLVAAAAVHEARLGRWRAHAVAFGVAALALPVLLLGGAGLLGSYSPAIEGDVLSLDAFRSAIVHVNVTAVALGIVPLILGGGWAIAALVRPPADPERSAFAGLVVATVACSPSSRGRSSCASGSGSTSRIATSSTSHRCCSSRLCARSTILVPASPACSRSRRCSCSPSAWRTSSRSSASTSTRPRRPRTRR